MFRYYLTSRPPGIGCQPGGVVNREVWMPSKEIPGSGWWAFGWVEYEEPLDPELIWAYELRPADEAERESYAQWREEQGK